MRTARARGYRTVAVYSDADREMPHVAFADEAVPIGAAPAAESYLAIDKIIAAAKRTGAEAIHPGYGFLSENADFAEACAAADLVFIGPPAAAIRLMGNKAAAKRRMIEAGVPCVPGYDGKDQSDEAFARAAAKIGFPVMVKAAAGGGGRGMRLVAEPARLAEALRAARAEALKAFGSDELILEKAVARRAPRGNPGLRRPARQCRPSRRARLLDPAPPPEADRGGAVPGAFSGAPPRHGRGGRRRRKAVDYVSAGTVEFLLARR